jgi:CheY-like chemotaxis protein
MKSERNTILLVEDDECDRFFFERAMRTICIADSVHLLTDGGEAISYLEGTGIYADRAIFGFPSYIITDLKMPRVDGFAVLRHLKSHPHLSVVPIVVLTGSTDTDDIQRAYELGASSYLVKPAAFDHLQRMLKKLFDFWSECEVPQVNRQGHKLKTNSNGKLGFIRQESEAHDLF